jgi:ubiquinone/menaquinone biosynthesis C-methylase UbiE
VAVDAAFSNRKEDPMSSATDTNQIRETVRQRYSLRALEVIDPDLASASGGCCTGSSCDPMSSGLYADAESRLVPEDALKASLGCGNPTALATLEAGETVLDLGSGGGIDVLLSARRVGPTGFVYGLDMTDEMLELAERNKRAQGATNVSFLKGYIEQVPLPDRTVDVVISNCVINLSADKGRVLREAFRVLKPGGRFAVSDVVVQGQVSPTLRQDMESWAGCVAGALEEGEYRRLLREAGFESIELEVTRVHDPEQLGIEAVASCCGTVTSSGEDAPETRIVSAFVRARKPGDS